MMVERLRQAGVTPVSVGMLLQITPLSTKSNHSLQSVRRHHVSEMIRLLMVRHGSSPLCLLPSFQVDPHLPAGPSTLAAAPGAEK